MLLSDTNSFGNPSFYKKGLNWWHMTESTLKLRLGKVSFYFGKTRYTFGKIWLTIYFSSKGSSRKYSLSSKTGTLLPEFPNAKNLILPAGTDLEKVTISNFVSIGI